MLQHGVGLATAQFVGLTQCEQSCLAGSGCDSAPVESVGGGMCNCWLRHETFASLREPNYQDFSAKTAPWLGTLTTPRTSSKFNPLEGAGQVLQDVVDATASRWGCSFAMSFYSEHGTLDVMAGAIDEEGSSGKKDDLHTWGSVA